jgi:hypothetical protein
MDRKEVLAVHDRGSNALAGFADRSIGKTDDRERDSFFLF